MGSRAHTLKKEIKEHNNAVLEIKGFSFEEKISHILYFNIRMEGNLERKRLRYEIIAKHEEKEDQPLYKSEGIKGMKTKTKIEFKSFSIPEIFITDNKKYDEAQISISFDDVMNKKKLGDYSGSLSSLIEKKTVIPLKEEIEAIINIEKIKIILL